MKPINTFIAGVTWYGAQDILPTLPQHTPLELVRELDNPYHSWAIVIIYKGVALGHMPTRAAERIAPLMDEGQYVAATLTRVRKEKWVYHGDLRVSFNPDGINCKNTSSANQPNLDLDAGKSGPNKTNWGRFTGIALAILFLLVFLNRGCGPY